MNAIPQYQPVMAMRKRVPPRASVSRKIRATHDAARMAGG